MYNHHIALKNATIIVEVLRLGFAWYRIVLKSRFYVTLTLSLIISDLAFICAELFFNPGFFPLSMSNLAFLCVVSFLIQVSLSLYIIAK